MAHVSYLESTRAKAQLNRDQADQFYTGNLANFAPGLTFDHAASFVAPGGFLFVGLYHSYGRRPFLQMYRELVARDGEEAAFAEFRRCAELLDDPTHSLSWFRDQVLHPHETQHSLAEVWTWLDAAGLSLVSTSLNTYGDISDRAALVRQEQGQEALSWQRNRDERSYFPGFFTVLACRA
ncbi:hypothetical protein ROE7235_02249 [Roseibaca ekhonensis]|uniref:Methyltransferase type 11 domain-containing protein n=1 Tax=Roseinatronobacter ekhonensis TaxID=254356 RepID=A0A3B0MS98_9RHOB|nr:hypothetical protein ROE7235_02249 [Roseibaca ekhonensis]